MLVLMLGKADVVVFFRCTGHAFTLGSPSNVESSPNTTDAGLPAFMSSQLPDIASFICALIASLWPTVLKLALKVNCVSDHHRRG
jgi:hypothetical protein